MPTPRTFGAANFGDYTFGADIPDAGMLWPRSGVGPSLSIYDRAGLLVMPPGREVEGLSLSTVMPGGCEACRFTLRRQATRLYPDLDYNFDVRLADERGIFWRGKIEALTPTLSMEEEYIEVTALGGGVAGDDQIYTSHTFTAGTSIQSAVGTVRSDLMASIVTEEALVTTGRTITADTTFTQARARSVLERLIQFGTSTNAPLQWAVWPDGTNYAYLLVLEARPTTAAYSINVLDFEHKGGFDGSLYFNRVRINYNAGASWRMVEDGAEQTLTGRTREFVISAPELTNTTDVDNVGNTALTLVKQRRVQAQGGVVSSRYAVRDANGQAISPWRVRAGTLLYIQGRMGTGLAGALDWANTAYIKATSYDDDSGQLSLTFETDQTTLEGMLSRLTKSLEI